MGHSHHLRMRSLSQSWLEKPKYKQKENMTGVWEPAVGFSGSLRVDPLEFSREEIRANISQKLDKYITV